MPKRIIWGLLLILAGVFIGRQHFGGQTWEYDYITFRGPLNLGYFDGRGAEGWEIAAIFKSHEYPSLETVVLKRSR